MCIYILTLFEDIHATFHEVLNFYFKIQSFQIMVTLKFKNISIHSKILRLIGNYINYLLIIYIGSSRQS